MKKEEPYFYLNYKCKNCGAEYGGLPNYCYGCGCNRFEKIKPKKSQI
jgi:lipopolysaccharide biosynthesis regulator YciM